MPELPDIEAYLHALRPRMSGRALERITIVNPFVLRSVEPPIDAVEGGTIRSLRRIGKRIAIEVHPAGRPEPIFIVVHLMIAGRLLWREPAGKAPGRIAQAMLRVPDGVLVVTEAGTTRRASVTLVAGETALRAIDPGGLELLDPVTTPETLGAAVRRQNRTLKRTLTDPRTISGVGNAYSDEILHAACLSPIALTSRLTDAEVARLLAAARAVLSRWAIELSERFAARFPGPGEVTAFRPEFASHGRFGQPCPVCAAKIQRIVRADNETNYCPGCQTEGRILADRSLSRLLKGDWPRAVEDLEA